MTVERMRLLLVLFLLAMYVLALLYLRRRALTPAEYFGWGLLIVLVPFLGPFLVILMKPGTARRNAARRFPILGRKL